MIVRKITDTKVPELGKKIKEARLDDKRSLAQICREIPMSPVNWYKIESEETKALPIETLRRIEQVLGIDLDVHIDT